jgi:Skp family chaperone for outer membrane proteins
MTATRFHLFSTVLGIILLAAGATAQVTLKRGAVVYHGSAANTTAPATIDEKKVREATVEWQTIESEGINPDSARGKQLFQKMTQRIREAVKAVASDENRDLVVRSKDIADDQGHTVVDLTDKVIEKIEEE